MFFVCKLDIVFFVLESYGEIGKGDDGEEVGVEGYVDGIVVFVIIVVIVVVVRSVVVGIFVGLGVVVSVVVVIGDDIVIVLVLRSEFVEGFVRFGNVGGRRGVESIMDGVESGYFNIKFYYVSGCLINF